MHEKYKQVVKNAKSLLRCAIYMHEKYKQVVNNA